MKLYKYIVKSDSGFAPNPFYGYCTLACCKPDVRRCADLDDFVIGLTPWNKGLGNKVVYFMKVTEKIEKKDYFKDKRFKNKIPCNEDIFTKEGAGDNIWSYKNGIYVNITMNNRNLKLRHVKEKEYLADIGKNHENAFVLISDNFFYFGGNAIESPSEFAWVKIGKNARGIRKNTGEKKIESLESFFIENYKKGINGYPTKFGKIYKYC